ncbi:phosphoadenylyl-sulfate reductase [Dongia soli]|uniref:Adenosine 5'-phosphosulfate reductase n=1 Tax=Dongia soli TaxID=600628 RepID=A0ABU5E8G1_9PROT|nr:phosphoadenylyl-sulfate reductase [Dongia soli]MDY0882572.1 phosphoadenylyl-sulfate reductase [Dongia soli]
MTDISASIASGLALPEDAPISAATEGPVELAARLNARWHQSSAEEILRDAVETVTPGRLAVVSSFGADAAILLHLVAETDRTLPILFIDTGKHFTETLMYRDILVGRFGFTDARALEPNLEEIKRLDPKGDLWSRDPNLCCQIRKVDPLQRALKDVDAWITGRKRYQTSARKQMPFAEAIDGRVKINPLASWSEDEIRVAFRHFKLPQHPLFDEGYRSIGCAPCTARVATEDDSRAGRWSGTDKTECGIHI